MNTVSFNSLGKQGRLGNQMFQFTALLAISKENNFNFLLPDPSKVNYKDYKLFDLFELNNVNDNNFGISNFNTIKTDDINDLSYSVNFFKLENNINLEGYFQSIKFVQKVQEEIKNNFLIRETIINKLNEITKNQQIKLNEYVFIHIRKGDYLEKKEYHFNLGMSYYKNAMNQFKMDQKFLIFSDDIELVKKEFPITKNVYFFSDFYDKKQDEEYDLIDFAAMTYCGGGIMSNSSFSWWAAYLQYSKGNICYPDSNSWYGYKYNIDTKELFFDNWKEISPGKFSLLILKFKRFSYELIFSIRVNLLKSKN